MAMDESPISDVVSLLKQMDPITGATFAFCQVHESTLRALSFAPFASFTEREGVTILVPVELAEELSLPIRWVGEQITLNVYSSLDAVGFLARITEALAEGGIAVNIFSAVSHDHIFVQPSETERALAILAQLSES